MSIIDREYPRNQELGLVSPRHVENIWAQRDRQLSISLHSLNERFRRTVLPQRKSRSLKSVSRRWFPSLLAESGYSSRVDAALAEMLDRRMETARNEYQLRCLLPELACVGDEDEGGSGRCWWDRCILQLLRGSKSQLFLSPFNLAWGTYAHLL